MKHVIHSCETCAYLNSDSFVSPCPMCRLHDDFPHYKKYEWPPNLSKKGRNMNINDPKWSDIIDTLEFTSIFNIKSGFGPYIQTEQGEQRAWNRCWSHIPKLWEGPVRNLINKISAKYKLEKANDPEDGEYDVIIDQVKDKYGTIRVYFTTRTDEIMDDLYKLVEECEEELKAIDPFYGVPW